jgi:hypothetical protein
VVGDVERDCTHLAALERVYPTCCFCGIADAHAELSGNLVYGFAGEAGAEDCLFTVDQLDDALSVAAATAIFM